MALTKKTKFEDDVTTNTAVADAPEQAEADAAVTATTAVAKAATTAVAAVGGKPETALASLKDVFKVEYDTFPRLVAGAGNVEDGDGNDLGSEITLKIVSWQDQFDLVPGSQDDEAKAHVRYSDDGVTVNGTGESCADYLANLKNNLGYDKASMKQRVVLVGVLTGAEKGSTLVGKTVQVNLSPQARKTFERHCFDRTIQAQMNIKSLDGAENIKINALRKTAGTNKYTLLAVSDAG